MLDEASGSELRRCVLNQNVSPRGLVESRGAWWSPDALCQWRGVNGDPSLSPGLRCTSSVNKTTIPSVEGADTLAAGGKGAPYDSLCP